ncbi:type VI secretion system contractile sheath small subunit [Aliidiomarina soli]|uniref:Type VI secretion system contractile sheath small subunit n=1 Tax=Aliidiomarina soli TaxID=1928574 RepID=A0A432WIT6_9GAMM|nr:type VI secretion system contractile sheath small subunit [Aliidiomarina soli]RUO33742.1 type VI secretion system contractile sheath small subunit [Aliidiomarina soli]
MSSSFQNEIPRARVNISLALETGGATQKKELPFKILVMGDFSHGQSEGSVKDRERINITSNNLEQVMENMSPTMNFSVPNRIKNDESEIKVELTASSFSSFHPEQVAYQIPEVSELLSMRNLLKDLKSNLLDNASLRKEVERVLNSEGDLSVLKDQLKGLIADYQAQAEEPAAE